MTLWYYSATPNRRARGAALIAVATITTFRVGSCVVQAGAAFPSSALEPVVGHEVADSVPFEKRTDSRSANDCCRLLAPPIPDPESVGVLEKSSKALRRPRQLKKHRTKKQAEASNKPTYQLSLLNVLSTLPTEEPSESPSLSPSFQPSLSNVPSTLPTEEPSESPSLSTLPSMSSEPSSQPSLSNAPSTSFAPSSQPSLLNAPSPSLSSSPSQSPAFTSTSAPTSKKGKEGKKGKKKKEGKEGKKRKSDKGSKSRKSSKGSKRE